METTFEPSLLDNFRSKIALMEFIELSFFGFALWTLGAFHAVSSGESFFDQISFLFGLELILLGSWTIYNVYIRIARAGGRIIDILIWIVASLATASYTFWAWSILDINRLIIAKLLYRGEAPVEYAWSAHSKQARKFWEQARKAG
ncbi:MAG TPA: hypothetical protein VK897_08240 [Anaerolineales bacterium]|nr:hypothetical protein [Anaerolineales bacterium]